MENGRQRFVTASEGCCSLRICCIDTHGFRFCLSRKLLDGFQLLDVDARLRFWDCAVVDLNLCGFTKNENALNGFAVSRDNNALRNGIIVGSDCDGDFGRRITCI